MHAARRDERARTARAASTRAGRLSFLRLLTFVGGVVLLWQITFPRSVHGLWLLAPVLLFVALVAVHARAIAAQRRAERAQRFHEDALARLDTGRGLHGPDGAGFLDPHHLFAADLDLFGPGSLFHRIARTRTETGAATLARWLTEAATPADARARQEAVAELRDDLDLRESLAIVAEEVRDGVHSDRILTWAEAPSALPSPVMTAIAWLLTAVTLGSVAGWALGWGFGASPLVIAFLLDLLYLATAGGPTRHAASAAEEPGRELVVLGELLRHLEVGEPRAALLKQLRARLLEGGAPPSASITSLRRRLDLVDSMRNQMFAPIGVALLWTVHLGRRVEAWRLGHGRRIRGWMEVAGELEALASLAGYAYERPDDTFPELLDEGATYDAEAIGHPLLPDETCIRNDLRLGPPDLVMVSGSNMSGKSTLLRAVGLNAVLALAGAPVRARRLRMGPLVVGASIRTQDSIQEGTSRFYAEIKRLRDLVELAGGERPLLFLVDELLSGTNSHDRRSGAEAVVKGLVTRGGIGLVTTHDLALTRVPDDLGARAVNKHFEDRLEDGTIRFDYELRDGVVTRSNALALMRAIGLDVEELSDEAGARDRG